MCYIIIYATFFRCWYNWAGQTGVNSQGGGGGGGGGGVGGALNWPHTTLHMLLYSGLPSKLRVTTDIFLTARKIQRTREAAAELPSR